METDAHTDDSWGWELFIDTFRDFIRARRFMEWPENRYDGLYALRRGHKIATKAFTLNAIRWAGIIPTVPNKVHSGEWGAAMRLKTMPLYNAVPDTSAARKYDRLYLIRRQEKVLTSTFIKHLKGECDGFS